MRPGSSKEDLIRRYAEEQLMSIGRRYVKKFSNETGDQATGYKSFGEACRDMDSLVNLLWLSGTRASVFPPLRLADVYIASLQIPFLLRLVGDLTQYVRSFPPSPKASFALLGKLDHVFASLLSGQDSETKETLPGFENGLRAGMTTTDMVRCRSLVEQTRVLMVEVLSSNHVDEEEEEDDEDTEMETTDTEGGASTGATWDIDEDSVHLDAARIFEKTIVQLNERLGDPITEGAITSPADGC